MPWMEANGVALRYELSGEGPETLILVHELGGALESWNDVLPTLDHTRQLSVQPFQQFVLLVRSGKAGQRSNMLAAKFLKKRVVGLAPAANTDEFADVRLLFLNPRQRNALVRGGVFRSRFVRSHFSRGRFFRG